MRTLAPTIAPPTPLAWAFDPVEGVARWPGDRRLAALVSGVGGRWSRWSLLAAPAYSETISSPNAHALTTLRRALDTPPTARGEGFPPLAPGRVVTLSYELGRAFEASSMTRPGVAPLAEVHECPGAAVYDHAQRRWWLVGDPAHVPDLAAEAPATHTASVGTFVSASGRGGYTDAVRTALAYIGAGDVYQVNLAHRLRAGFQGSARSLFVRAARAMAPWYGAYVESAAGGAALSFSPELFLSYDNASRLVVTRPIKGTRAASAPPDELRASVKDQAELAMIVDLMRNDLGRVCAFGSVRVPDPRGFEVHGGVGDAAVLHSVATVEGRLRDDLGLYDLLGASFPPGSVTGAPKVRAMQIIDELEPVSRGAYCGSIGFVSDTGDAGFNVAIRTAQICGVQTDPARFDTYDGSIDYHVGAGIVADSDPDAEWHETLDKAAGFLSAIGGVMERDA